MIGTLLEKLFVAVEVDLSEMGSELDKARADVSRLSKDLSRDFEAVGKRWQATGSKMMKTGAVMTAGITAPLVLFGKQSAQAAIDAEEMNSAFDVVFGEMADSTRKWAEETGNAMGRSTQEIQRGTLAFQELFGKALDPAKATEMSKTFAVLTQDLASFKNLSNEVAQQKLFSGLTGEAEPLRAVGVFINESAVQAKLLEMGLQKVNGKFTDQQKILGRAALIREQLAQADGDVMRTSESTANQIKRSEAAWEELSVTVGNNLLPALTPLVEIVGDMLNAFNELDPGVQTFIVGAAAVAAVLGPIITGVGAIVTGFGMLMPVIGAAIPIISGIAGALAGLAIAFWPITLAVGAVVAAWYFWDDIVAIVERVGRAISSWYDQNLKPTVDAAMEIVREIADFFLEYFAAHIEDAIALITALMNGDFSEAWEIAKRMVARAVEFITRLFGEMVPKVLGFMGKMVAGIRQWLVGKLGEIWDWVKGKIKSVGEAFYWLYDAVVGNSYIPDMVKGIGDEMAKLDALMVKPAEKAAKKTGDVFRRLAEDTREIFDRLFPDEAEIRAIQGEIATIERSRAAGQISDASARRATGMLNNEISAIRAAQAGPSQEVTNLVASLLPRESKIISLRREMELLDAAIAAGKGNVEMMRKAREALNEEMAEATEWEFADDLKALTQELFPLQAEMTGLKEDVELLNAALAAGEIDPERYEEAKAKLLEAMDVVEEAMRRQALMADTMGRNILMAENFGRDLGDTIMGSLHDLLSGKQDVWSKFKDGLSRVLDNALSHALRNLEMSIFGEGGLGGFLGKLFGSALSGGARAVGGPALPGRIYNVGTGEPFVPSSHGRILSRTDAMKAVRDAMGSGGMGGATNITVQVAPTPGMSDREARRTGLQIGRGFRETMAKNSKVQPA